MRAYAKWTYRMAILLISVSFGCSVYFAYRVNQIDLGAKLQHFMEKPKYHLVMINQEGITPYWSQIQSGADKAAKELDAVIEYVVPVHAAAQDLSMVEMAVASKVDGIIMQGFNEKEFTPAINKAVDSGIPVITIDTDAPGSKRIAFVGTDNFLAGRRAAKEIVKDTNGSAKVGILTGSFSISNQTLRVAGFLDGIKDTPGIEVVAVEETSINSNLATEKAYKILKEHPDVTVFFGTGSLDGVGAAEVANNAERPGERIKVYAFDDLPETMELIKQKRIDATFVQRPFSMGEESVRIMVEFLKGKKTLTVYNTDIKTIRETDIASYNPEEQG
ncbi:sugar-binding protein [Paenibacillus thermoaerophilus]|uniref:Sugar-binding protein n=1 Tax=Paenibacillus thermoaerophilus TaxID=1215385 RepID=A0ABW2V7R6_9BACL|nr:sugar-binding protein [Paenibacillus thermoaerophilus]TMV05481.1 sugar ABC transporter substrate-binding protein [Paenibacillus thermoaerophilus]